MTRWDESDGLRGDEYARLWRDLEAAGVDPHGEAELVDRLLQEHSSSTTLGRVPLVLDAGCGTGRVAIELARRGYEVVGVDRDPAMLTTARADAGELTWIEADLATLEDRAFSTHGVPTAFDLVVLAGNVMIFVAPGTETEVVARLAARLKPGGLLVAGFQLRTPGYDAAAFAADLDAAGLKLVARFSTWSGDAATDSDRYGVFLARLRG